MSTQAAPFCLRRGIDSFLETKVADIPRAFGLLTMAIWSRTTRRFHVLAIFVALVVLAMIFSDTLLSLSSGVNYPVLKLEYSQTPASRFNESKVGLLVENRPFPILAPLMLHFISVVPPDWRFRFMGSIESVEQINKSVAIREQVKLGKLDLTYIPSNMSTGSQEEISRFLTTSWLYEAVLQPAEWLLVFQTDSILCANSRHDLNEYLEYDWIGAPWTKTSSWGGNGGLSLRRVSAIIDVLREQVRVDFTNPEDVWLAERLGHRPKSKVANASVSLTFSGEQHQGALVELDSGFDVDKANRTELENAARAGKLVKGIDDWRIGHYEPMGFHTGGSGTNLFSGIWGNIEAREHIWKYCPEIKMTLAMDVAKYVPGTCGANWKRSVDIPGATPDSVDIGYGTEIIDDVLYPVLPPGLTPF